MQLGTPPNLCVVIQHILIAGLMCDLEGVVPTPGSTYSALKLSVPFGRPLAGAVMTGGRTQSGGTFAGLSKWAFRRCVQFFNELA